MERRITKIKAKQNPTGKKPVEILIEYQIPESTAEGGYIKAEFICHEEPRDELWQEMSNFLPLYITLIGLDQDIWSGGEIIGLSIKYLDEEDEEGNDIGLTIVGKCDVDGHTACPPSPFARFRCEAIAKITHEALAYIDGERSTTKPVQQSLF